MKKGVIIAIIAVVLCIAVGSIGAGIFLSKKGKEGKKVATADGTASSELVPLYNTADSETPSSEEQSSEEQSEYDNPEDYPYDPDYDEGIEGPLSEIGDPTGILLQESWTIPELSGEDVGCLRSDLDDYFNHYAPEKASEKLYNAYYIDGSFSKVTGACSFTIRIEGWNDDGSDLCLDVMNNLPFRDKKCNIKSDLSPDGTWEFEEYTSMTGLKMTRTISTY